MSTPSIFLPSNGDDVHAIGTIKTKTKKEQMKEDNKKQCMPTNKQIKWWDPLWEIPIRYENI
jgi:hypothetical protein